MQTSQCHRQVFGEAMAKVAELALSIWYAWLLECRRRLVDLGTHIEVDVEGIARYILLYRMYRRRVLLIELLSSTKGLST